MTTKVQVQSTAIVSLEYDEETRILKVEFKRGAVYDYPAVPKEEFDNLVKAESIGKYFNTHIKQYSVPLSAPA